MNQRETFSEFYPVYLAAHRHPVNRALHGLAKLAMLAALALGALEQRGSWLLAAPAFGVAPCWLGHLLFERNRPTAWTRPSASLLGSLAALLTGAMTDGSPGSRRGRCHYSFLADLRMCGDGLRDVFRRAAG